MSIFSRLWDVGVEWGNVQEHVVSFSLLQRALETPLFLGLDKSGDREQFLGEIFYYYSENFSGMVFC